MRSYSHLSEDERDQIGVLRAAGRSMGAIARALGRAKATISRELQRNALGYSPLHAAGAYQLRRWHLGVYLDGLFQRHSQGRPSCHANVIWSSIGKRRRDSVAFPRQRRPPSRPCNVAVTRPTLRAA